MQTGLSPSTDVSRAPWVLSAPGPGDYAGDLEAPEAFALLKDNPKAVLVDVRSSAEWSFVGLPDLTSLKRQPLCVEWQTFPGMSLNVRFLEQLQAALKQAGAGPNDPVLFMCRSGARSKAAAMALTEAGYAQCYNISEGFEGSLDTQRHRGHNSGWKASGLPWVQS